MSELRVALVAEGPTDAVVIEAALKAVLSRPFTLARLQPEPTLPQLGTGWCGVFKWCREFANRGQLCLEHDPLLPGFDLFVIHIDADVAEKSYADGGPGVVHAAAGLPPLPCSRPCPPPAAAADELRACLLAWLGLAHVGPRTAMCVPSKAIETWLAVAVLGSSHSLLSGLECNLGLAGQLAVLPKVHRVRKTARDYHERARAVTANWAAIAASCTQAERFTQDVAAVFAVKTSP